MHCDMRKYSVIILVLLLSNILTLSVVYKLEKKTNYIKHYLERQRGIKQSKLELPAAYWCIQGWSNTLEKLNYDCDVCFFGHSHIEESDFRFYFPDKRIVNLGYPGDNIGGMLLRVEQIKSVQPEKIFVMAGVNSLWMPKDEFECMYDSLLTKIQTEVPHAELYIFNILPQSNGILGNNNENSKIKEYNELLFKYATHKRIQLIDLYSIYVDSEGNLISSLTYDGVHLKKEAYSSWAARIKPFIDD